MRIAKGNKSITVKPLTAFNSDRYGLDTLINWRKGEPSFRQVSVTEVISNQVPPDLFRDRIVVIGNVSASTADRHHIPLNRSSDSWSYGVQIPAQVASSIVSAALDERPLLQAIPKSVELSLVLISAMAIATIIGRYRHLDSKKIYLATFCYAFSLTTLLILFGLIGSIEGWWIPIATAIGTIWIIYLLANYYIYQERGRKNALKLEMFVRDLQHSLGNPLNSIASSSNRIIISAREINDSKVQENGLRSNRRSIFEGDTQHSEEPKETTVKQLNRIQHLTVVHKRALDIEKQVLRIERYRKRTQDFIDFGYSRKINALELTDINQLVSEIVRRFQSENKYDYQVNIHQDYDVRLSKVRIDRTAMEIVIENLLDNAACAVALRESSSGEHDPLIEVKTKQNKKTIELRVEDNGIGVPVTLRQKIFQPFVSFNHRQGIGLYLTKRILSLHQGNIRVESKQPRGCKFIVTIPSKLGSLYK